MKRAVACILALLCAACGKSAPPQAIVRAAVAATLTALPTSLPAARPSPLPSPTPASLENIFCEYQFCIGHPQGMAFFDVVAKQNPNAAQASTYDAGTVAANNSTTFIQLTWRRAPSNADPMSLMDLVVEDGLDTVGGPAETLPGPTSEATFVPLTTTATQLLPTGVAAAWTCGERGFAWKAYADQPAVTRALLSEALDWFRCDT